eukprot:6295224-Prymnesium_polylepis.2
MRVWHCPEGMVGPVGALEPSATRHGHDHEAARGRSHHRDEQRRVEGERQRGWRAWRTRTGEVRRKWSGGQAGGWTGWWWGPRRARRGRRGDRVR